jgi:hypothetical protein
MTSTYPVSTSTLRTGQPPRCANTGGEEVVQVPRVQLPHRDAQLALPTSRVSQVQVRGSHPHAVSRSA